jgi:hypothetical protein
MHPKKQVIQSSQFHAARLYPVQRTASDTLSDLRRPGLVREIPADISRRFYSRTDEMLEDFVNSRAQLLGF